MAKKAAKKVIHKKVHKSDDVEAHGKKAPAPKHKK